MTPEEKIAITTSRQAIVVAIIGAIASILISFRGDILPKVETENMESIQKRIDQKVNEVVTARLELTDDKIEYQTMPIGAIITSILDYDSFLDLNNSTQRNFDIEKSEWSPCDGRSVAGSKYGYKKPIAPDLRGLFIRGVNDMGVPGSNRINDNQLNPEKKNVGEFQSDAIRSHSHKLLGGGKTESDGESFALNNKQLNVGGQGAPGKELYFDKNTNGKLFIQETGTKETRPKNMTVYYYIKIN